MNHLWKRFLSLTLALLMVVSMVPVQAFAAENVEEMGTVESAATEAAGNSASEKSEDVVPETTVTPEPTKTQNPVPEKDTAVEAVQALIDALPVAVNSAEEAEALNAALAAVSDAIAELTTEQAEQVDMSRFDEATLALTNWMGNSNGAEVYADTYNHVIPEDVQKKPLSKQTNAKLKESDLYSDVDGDYYWVKAAANETVNDNRWSQIKVGGLLSDPDSDLDIDVGDTIHVAKQTFKWGWKGSTYTYTYTYTDEVIYTVVAPAAELTANETATIPFNGYLKAGEQMAGGTGYADVRSEKYLEALILENLNVKLGDTVVTAKDPNVTIQYFPWRYGTLSGDGDFSETNKLKDLNANAPDSDTVLGMGYSYRAFGERFQNGDTTAKEKVIISYKVDEDTTLSVTREISLTEGRKTRQIDYQQGDSKDNPIAYTSTDTLVDDIQKKVTLSGLAWDGITLVNGSLPEPGETAEVTITVKTDSGDATYAPVATFPVWVKAPDAAASVTISVTGNGTVDFGGLTATGTLTPGSYALTATPSGERDYLDSAVVQCGEETLTAVDGKYALEGGKSYTVAVTFKTLTLKDDATISVNKYTLLGSDDRIDGLKGKILTAVVGEEATADDYTVTIKGTLSSYNLDKLDSAGKLALSTLLQGSESITVTVTYKGAKATATVKLAESRQTPTITLGETAFTADTLNDLKTQIKNAVVVKDSKDTDVTAKAGVSITLAENAPDLTKDAQTYTVTVKVNLAGETWLATEKETTVQATLAQYTITWNAGDGAFADEQKTITTTQYYGETVVAPESKPAKEQTVSTTYTFKEWKDLKEDTTVTGAMTFTAEYSDAARKYTVTWKAGEGFFDVEGEKKASVTTEVVYGGIPSQEAPTAPDGMSFEAWEVTEDTKANVNDDGTIKGNVTYTAKYTDDTIYTITWNAGEGAFADGNATKTDSINLTKNPGATISVPTGTAAPTRTGYILTGWTATEGGQKIGEVPTANGTFTAQWAPDFNGNGVDDEKETLTVKIDGAGENDVVKIGSTELKDGDTYIFDSTKEETLTITATPVVESNLSKTYVVSMTNVGEVTYGKNYVATASFQPQKDMEIIVTFAAADFVLNDERVLNYYPGMEGVTSQDVYETAVSSPELAPNAEITVEYLARKKGETVYINIDKLKFSDNSYVDSGIKTILKEFYKGSDGKIPVTQSETWVELGTDLSEFNFDSVPNYEEMFNKILKEKLESITLKNAIAVIQSIIQDIENTSQYYGAHEFGKNASTSQDTPETIRLTYTDDQRNIQTTTTITLHDYRIPTQIVGSDMTLTYKNFKDSDLLDMVTVKTVNGATVDGATVALAQDSKGIEEEKVSVCSVTFRYAGDKTYKPAEATFQVTITKAPASMDIDNVIVTYDDDYTMDHNIVPGNAYGDATEIEKSLIRFVVGLNVADLSVGESGVTGTKTIVQIMLPEDLKSGLGELTGNWFENGVEMSLSALLDALELIDTDSLEVLKQALEAIQKVTGDFTVRLGGNLPTDIGTYLYGAVSTTGNYETVLDIAYIIIKPDAERVWLDWNYTDTNGIFTDALLQYVDLGASAYDDEAHEDLNADATAKVRNLFFGVNKGADNKPALVLKLYGTGIDPETFETDLGNGGFTQMAFIADFGNTMHYAIPIVRAFAIAPNTVDVQITDGENTNFRRTYDGEKQELTITVNGEVPENGLEVTYVGMTTKGKAYKSATAPTDAGAYVVTALYRAHDDNDKLTGIGMAVKNLLVLPAGTETTVDDTIVTVGEKVALKDIVHITAAGNPDVTILTAQIATDGSFSEIGVDAISGNVNVDFPAWVDVILRDKAPEIFENGVTVGELSEILNGKIKTALESLNLCEELTASLTQILDQLNESLNSLPLDATVTFNDTDETVFSQVGVYLVGAMVTDSNYRVSADYGLVVVKPNVQQVYLDWNYHDDNGIWTEELLKNVDLYASAYSDPEFRNKDEVATASITHTFLTVDSNGEVKVYHNAEDLNHGAYLELAYIELDVDGTMTLSNLIARPIVTVANVVKVEFVDENNTVISTREFTYNGNPHAMNVRVTKSGNPVDVQAGELTVTYRGLTTAGEVYNSTNAPTDAGAYTVTAVYARYEGGKLIDGGATVGTMVIKPAKVNFSVTGGIIPWDDNLHGVSVSPEDIPIQYTVISGTAKVDGTVTEIGLEAVSGNLNVDFPAWVDSILEEKCPDIYKNGIDAKTLIEKLDALNLPDTWVDTLVELLKKVPSNVNVTFQNNIQFKDPGVYVFAGFLTDFNYVPAADTALLVIQKRDSGLKFENTEVYYNGKSQSIRIINPEETKTDYVTAIVDRKNNIANVIFEDDLKALKNLLEEALGYAIPDIIDVTALMNAINDAIEKAQALENLPVDVKAALEQMKSLVEKLPQNGTIYIDGGWRPVDAGEYEFYGVALSPVWQTKLLSGILTIKPAEITIAVKDAEKMEGAEDPVNLPDITIQNPEGATLDTSILNIQVSRVKGEDVGEYQYIVTYKENANFEVTVDAGKLNIKAKNDGNNGNDGDDNKTNKYPIPFVPDNAGTIWPGATVEIDGKPYVLDADCTAWVDHKDAKIAQTFTYNQGKDAHHTYPTHMYVWYLSFVEGDKAHYNAEPIPELTDFFQYHGTSIRVNFTSNGIRFMTSVNEKNANALIGGTLIQTDVMAGYRMTQAGTLFKWYTGAALINDGNTASSLVYGIPGESGFRVFQKVGDRNWFTGMLTNLGTDKETLDKDLVSRPYAVLERNGETVTIYGGTIQRSIYYVAKQNESWKVGTAYNAYIQKIIAAVEGQ